MAGLSYTLAELAALIDAACDHPEASFRRVSTDTRTLEPGDVFFALSGERFDGNKFVAAAFAKGAAAAVTTRESAAGPCLVVDDPLRALQRFAAGHRARFDIPVLAVTGSCGKTTAKDLTAAVLATRHEVVKTPGNLNNEIGCPLSLLQIGPDTGLAVIEMGANHAGEIAHLCGLARPTEAAITMIGPAHLEGFGTVEHVARAKAEILEGLGPDGVFYANADDARCVALAASFPGRTVYFGGGSNVRVTACDMARPGELRLAVHPVGELELPLYCPAQAANVLLAIAVGLEHGVTEFQEPLAAACQGAARFQTLAVGPLTIIDDSYNANPASMAAALDALGRWPGARTRLAALGEMLELGEAAAALHRETGSLAGPAGVGHLFASGPHACDTIAGARSSGVPHAETFDDPAAMARAIHEVAGPGDVLLVKGSRAMRMERVTEALRNLYS